MNCWILITKDDENGSKTQMWKYFKKENVIAIGWDVPKDKWADENEIASCIQQYSINRKPGYFKRSANTVFNFVTEIQKSDKVFLCNGYNSTQEKVKILGIAEEIGDPRYDNNSDWWKIKRSAFIKVYEIDVPRVELAELLGEHKGTVMNTLTKLDCDNFLKLQSYLRDKLYLKED